jgi:glycosyltransferase involved in cell wall biosynthesis
VFQRIYDVSMALISIVSPVYNESAGIKSFCEAIFMVFNNAKYDLEIILCVDPSTDGTESLIEEIHKNDHRVKLISFARRVGQDKATQAGIDFANGDAVIVMDSDHQDPIDTIPIFLEEWEKGAQIVYATRISRKQENLVKRFSANLFYRVLNSFSEVDIPRNTGDFRLMDKRVVTELRKYREDTFFLRALTPVIGFETKRIEISRPARLVGETKYNRFFGGIKAAFIAIYGYTNLIQKIFLALTLVFFLTLVLFLLYFSLFSFKIPNSPNTVLFLLIFFGLSVLLLLSFMGWVLASYLDRIYKQGRNRPNYTVAYKIGIEN